jgi:hypothetical protein
MFSPSLEPNLGLKLKLKLKLETEKKIVRFGLSFLAGKYLAAEKKILAGKYLAARRYSKTGWENLSGSSNTFRIPT